MCVSYPIINLFALSSSGRRVMILFLFIFLFLEGGGGGVLGVLIGGGGKGFVFLPEWVGSSL